MDVNKKYNQNVLKAIANLQERQSLLIPVQTIIQQVIFQMRRKIMLEPVISKILKSLKSLTEIGILTRSRSSEYGFHKFPIASTINKSTKRRLTNHLAKRKQPISSCSSFGSKRSQYDDILPVIPTFFATFSDQVSEQSPELTFEDSAGAVELNTTLMNSVEVEPKNNPILDE
ncbi:uncharacterized protein LOC6563360 [Drosophila grimshawi]|uniref:GH19574 n=1 Tax=Drosophila grimshawi TaxID=7222 RepID=B4JHP0_DROGR|nr:uncharacterized protein LOC6563360 [Drosophila grimshawi]EDV93879.1 GH19574 [Drosophila grimshawi]